MAVNCITVSWNKSLSNGEITSVVLARHIAGARDDGDLRPECPPYLLRSVPGSQRQLLSPLLTPKRRVHNKRSYADFHVYIPDWTVSTGADPTCQGLTETHEEYPKSGKTQIVVGWVDFFWVGLFHCLMNCSLVHGTFRS
jgi:hypothetical protein